MRVASKLAAAMIVVGAVLLAAPTFGVTTLAADRGASVQIAADQSEALLGFEDPGERIEGRQDTATALRLHNNFGEPIDVAAVATVDTDDVEIVSSNWDGSGFDLGTDGEETIELACSGGGTSGTATVTVDVTRSSGGSLTVSDASRTIEVPYECTGNGGGGPPSDPGGFESATASDVVVTDGVATQEFTFRPDGAIGNDDAVEITIGSVNIDYSGAEIGSVEGVGNNADTSFDGGPNGGTIVVSDRGQSTAEVTVTLTGMEPTGAFFEFGFVEFTRTDGESAGPYLYGVTEENGGAGSLGIASTEADDTDETLRIERSELSDAPLEKFDDVDTVDELAAVVEADPDAELVDGR